MDVMLIKPDFRDIAVLPPLGLGYLAAVLLKRGVSVGIHDNTLFGYDDGKLAELIKEANPAVIGIGAATPMIKRAMEIAGLIKKINPEILTVLGGPHPSCTVEETLMNKDVDAVVMDEGEETLSELVNKFLGGSRDFSGIKGCAFKSAGCIVTNPRRGMIDNLDSLPFPAFDLMPIELYFKKKKTFGILQKSTKSLPVFASRGCPSKCTFCLRFLGKKLRVRSAENIVDELMERKKTYGVTEFNFLDDNFTLHKRRVIELCELIHKRGLNITFRFPNGVREDFLDEEILEALKSVGCYHLDFGIESGSQKVLDIMKKGKKIEEITEKVYLSKKYGFKVSSSFLFGTPGETLDDMEETIRYAASLPLDSASFGIITPFPGTELRKECIEKGWLVHSDYEYYNIAMDEFRPLIETPEWKAEDLIRMVRRGNRAFFMRPRRILKLLPTMINPVNVKRYITALSHVIRGK